uniref:Uncharacterized protein n=1 Tax=Setaria italica TaxID=4555 RepID=K3ZP76_SETIT
MEKLAREGRVERRALTAISLGPLRATGRNAVALWFVGGDAALQSLSTVPLMCALCAHNDTGNGGEGSEGGKAAAIGLKLSL